MGRVSGHLPVAVPEVVCVGEPDLGYPEKWSVVRWLEGYVPDGDSVPLNTDEKCVLATDLGHVVSCLRATEIDGEARADSSLRWYRGDPLAALDEGTQGNFDACASIVGLDLDLDALRRIWADALLVPAAHTASRFCWYHGDLVAENILVKAGRLSAVLDFGGLGIGDPTVDLIIAWDVLDPISRDVFRSRAAIDEQEWRLGRAWALALAVMTFPYYWNTMPARCASRLALARAVIDDARRHD